MRKTHIWAGWRVEAHSGSAALTRGRVGSPLRMSQTFGSCFSARRSAYSASPCGVSVGVSDAAARPWGNVHFIQLLFHVTKLLSAASVSESPKISSVFFWVREH